MTEPIVAVLGTPYLPDEEYVLNETKRIVRLAPDGSRRVIDSRQMTAPWAYGNHEFIIGWGEGDPLVVWDGYDSDLHRYFTAAAREGNYYLPYAPADGIAIPPVQEHVNNVPDAQNFISHCTTFAHELLTDFHPHAPSLRMVDSWNISPDIQLDVSTIQKNRVGLRYFRGVLGYFYTKAVEFEALPPNPADVGQFERDWRDELPEMLALDRYVCGECLDDGGGSKLRDFIHHCNVAAWDGALDTMEQLSVGATVQYRGRVPKVDRGNLDDIRPHPTQNVRDWISNNNSVESGWRSMMRDFNSAVKRYDRDPSARMPQTHPV